MSADKETSSSDANWQITLVCSALAFVGIIVVIKYFFPLVTGFLVGMVLYGAKSYRNPYRKVATYGSGVLTFSLCMFVLFGLPTEAVSTFPGVLNYFDWYHELTLYVVRTWNFYCPVGLKGLRVQSFSLLDATRYSWLSLYTAVAVSLSLFGFEFMRKTSVLPRSIVMFLGNILSLSLCFPIQVIGRMQIRTSWANKLVALFTEESAQDLGKGFLVGASKEGNPFYLTEQNLAHHLQYIAPSGGGKTNFLKRLMEDRIRRGKGIIFVDYKGDFELATWLHRVARSANRENDFRLISLAHPEISVPYNPIRQGSAQQIESQLMNSMTWSEEHYKKIAEETLLTLLRGLTEYRVRTKELFHLGHLHSLLKNQNALSYFVERAEKLRLPSATDLGELRDRLERPSEREKILGLTVSLSLIAHSAAGQLLTTDVENGSFTLEEAIAGQKITYFLVNSLALRESARVFARLLLQDFMSLLGNKYSAPSPTSDMSTSLIIDEFASFAMPEFIEFMDRARGAGVGVILAHQSRADLAAITPEFQKRIEANANTTIVTGIQEQDDAQHFASMLGTRTTMKETVQMEKDFLFFEKPTGLKSVREAEEFIVHPNDIKSLKRGEILSISRVVDPRWGIVDVPRTSDWGEYEVPLEKLRKTLISIRNSYNKSGERYLDLPRQVPHASRRTPFSIEALGSLKKS